MLSIQNSVHVSEETREVLWVQNKNKNVAASDRGVFLHFTVCKLDDHSRFVFHPHEYVAYTDIN